MQWFGEAWPSPSWPAPVCEGPHAETPVGRTCSWCTEPICAGDNGVIMPFVGTASSGAHYATSAPIHKECWVRQVVGSVAHLDGLCSCFGAVEQQSPMSMRAEALLVYARMQEHEQSGSNS